MQIDFDGQSAIQSANNSVPKCKNGTLDISLEELAIINALKTNPALTQKQISELVGKSERTIKRCTVEMQEKGLIARENGKRNFLAKSAKFVYGVEIVDAAIQNTIENAKINNIENVKFFVGKAEEIITGEYENGNIRDIDVIVVDLPRKGLDKLAIDTMLNLLPKRIVYVSFDSSTLARDLKLLCEKEYELKKLTVVDQFSRSYHTEEIPVEEAELKELKKELNKYGVKIS